MALEHRRARQGADDEPVEDLRDKGTEDEEALVPFLRGGPVRRNARGRDEPRVEPEVREQEGRGGQGGEGEVERLDARLQVAKCLAREGAEGAVAGLLGRIGGRASMGGSASN